MRSLTRRVVALVFLVCLTLPVAARTINVHVQGGPGTGNLVVLRMVDAAGVVVLVRTIKVCTSYSFEFESSHPIYIQIWNLSPWRPMYFGWHTDAGDIEFNPPLPPPQGYCGDGNITNAESCDTKNNEGCNPNSSAPVCLGCIACGCTKDSHCPVASPAWGPCGYGRCAPEERPYFRRACAYGMCVLTYGCHFDPTCAAKDCNGVFDGQQECVDSCSFEGTRCRYGQSTGCWSCLSPGQVTDPCASPEETDCTLDPALLGSAFLEGTGADVAELLDQFSLDGLTNGEAETLFDAAGRRLPPVYIQFVDPHRIEWSPEGGAFYGWNLYRGSMNWFNDFGQYTQIPGINQSAGRLCLLSEPWALDHDWAPPGDVTYYLVTAIAEPDPGVFVESGIGLDSQGTERFDQYPCP